MFLKIKTAIVPAVLILTLSNGQSNNTNSSQLLLVHPEIAYTPLNGEVTFTCTKPDANMQIAWSAPFFDFFFTHHNEMTASLQTGINDVKYNNSKVKCVGKYDDQDQLYFSENEGTVLIQGYLSAIEPNTTFSNICRLKLYWNPPFTLPGVPILGYSINVTNANTNVSKHFDVANTSTSFTLPLDGSDYIISIAGMNQVGEGHISTIAVNSTESIFQNFTFEIADIRRDANIWIIKVKVDDEFVCDTNNKTVLFNFYDTKDIYTYNATNITVSNNVAILTANTSLPDNQHYKLSVIITTNNFTSQSDTNNISTFDVQEITNRATTNGSVCLVVNYVTGSIAKECYVKVYCGTKSIDFSITDGLQCSPPIGINGHETCTVEGYDKIGDVIEDINGPAIELTITVSEIPVVATSSVTTPSPSNNITDTPIIASAVAVVIFIILCSVLILICIVVCIRFKIRRTNNNLRLSKIVSMERQTSKVTPQQSDKGSYESYQYVPQVFREEHVSTQL